MKNIQSRCIKTKWKGEIENGNKELSGSLLKFLERNEDTSFGDEYFRQNQSDELVEIKYEILWQLRKRIGYNALNKVKFPDLLENIAQFGDFHKLQVVKNSSWLQPCYELRLLIDMWYTVTSWWHYEGNCWHQIKLFHSFNPNL